MGGIVARNM